MSESTLESPGEFLTLIERHAKLVTGKWPSHDPFWYRGQADIGWKLAPGALRIEFRQWFSSHPVERVLDIDDNIQDERSLANIFRRRAASLVPDTNDHLG